MYSYITEELPTALFESFEVLDASRVSITGHSMGGHGALTLVGLSFLLFLLHPSLLLILIHTIPMTCGVVTMEGGGPRGTKGLSIP